MADLEPGPAWLDIEPADDQGLLIRLSGDVDVAGLEPLEARIAELLEYEAQPLVVDMSDLRFIDSSGIAILIRLANHFQPVTLRDANTTVRRVIDVLGLSERLRLGPGGTRG